MSNRPRRSLQNSVLQRPSALNSVPRNPDLLWLDKNENLDTTLMTLSQEVLHSIPRSVLATYPESGELYRKIAEWVAVSPDHLLLTPGSDGAIRLVFETFIEHGDTVIVTAPTFAMYPVYSQMFGAQVYEINYERKNDEPYLNPKAVIDALQEHKPKLLCLPNPDSPTGTVLSPDALRSILTKCEEVETILLVDEAYHPFYEFTVLPWIQTSRNLIVARTFAKAWGAAGLRIGYAAAHHETIALLHKMRPMYEVSSLAVEYMSRMMNKTDEMMQSVARIKEGKQFFADEMQSLGFRVLPTSGNFLHVDFGERGAAMHAALTNKVLYRISFDVPCLKGYSRFSVAPVPIMAQVVDLIKQALK